MRAEHLPQILARGPWPLERVKVTWRKDEFLPSSSQSEAADAAIASLKERGSPSHDGLSGRLVDYQVSQEGIALELQPLRWALRLVEGDASKSVAALCVTRSADGRWLAGRRRPGSPRGRAAGRSAPAAPSISARAPPKRS